MVSSNNKCTYENLNQKNIGNFNNINFHQKHLDMFLYKMISIYFISFFVRNSQIVLYLETVKCVSICPGFE